GHVWINPYKHGQAIRTLEVLQNRILRKALGAVQTTPLYMLHFDTAVLSSTERLRMRNESYLLRTLTRPSDHPAHVITASILRRLRKKFVSPLNAVLLAKPMLEGLKEMETIVPHPFVPIRNEQKQRIRNYAINTIRHDTSTQMDLWPRGKLRQAMQLNFHTDETGIAHLTNEVLTANSQSTKQRYWEYISL
ncbi:hypothetical protein E3P86_01480, partial [Wallemia ichthyophaga]